MVTGRSAKRASNSAVRLSKKGIDVKDHAEDGGRVLVTAATVRTSVSDRKMLQPYWIYEGMWKLFPFPLACGLFHNVVQEMFFQRATPKGVVYAHKTSDVNYNENLQDEVWAWSKRATKA